ncbi:MAG: FAD:protein FMN transferase [Ruminococcaceae bacterium]|nr:FAD:protein FMN transferase [Oscillospiraceae bacterium]
MHKLLALFLCLFVLCGCRAARPLTKSGVAMDTVVSITLYDVQDAALLDTCFSKISEYEALFSRTDPASEISALNAADGAPVPLSAPVRDLLTRGKAWGERTDGAFDVTIAPVSGLWDFSAAALPDSTALREATALVDYTALTVTDQGACLPRGRAVDLGGIAKGYTADRLGAHLREAGVNSALIDLGGNILAVGDKGGRPFTVGIRDPFDDTALAATVKVRDRSVVTSGVYERSFQKDGVTYHHILDPQTGYPVQNGLVSVTILSASSADGDALSTACFVLGLEKGLALVESLADTEALFITADGTLRPSSGLVWEAL